MKLWRSLSAIFAICLSCQVLAGQPVSAIRLLWEEQEPGIPAYTTRTLITPEYLRSDDGQDEGDFVLFDRRSGVVYGVNRATRSVLEIPGGRVPDDAGPRPKTAASIEADPDAPKVANHALRHYRLTADDVVCREATLAEGLLPDATEAMAALQSALAARQYRELDKTPEEFQTPCVLANYLYEPNRHLLAGFPIRDVREAGQQRLLLDYRTAEPVSPDLFRLPPGYETTRLP